MNSDSIINIQNSLQVLYDALERIAPENALEKDPFVIYQQKIDQITEFIDKLTREAVDEENAIKEQIAKMQEQIQRWCEALAVQAPKYEDINNIHLRKAHVTFEFRRIESMRNSIKAEIGVLITEIHRISDRIGEPAPGLSSEVTLKNLTELRGCKLIFSEKARAKELRRKNLYESIKSAVTILGKTASFNYDENICMLERMDEEYQGEIGARNEEYRQLREEIARKEDYLGIELDGAAEGDLGDERDGGKKRAFSDKLDDSNLNMMREYCNELRQEIGKKLESIFGKARKELEEMGEIFGRQDLPTEATEANLELIRKMIVEMRPRKDDYCRILECIEKRRDLLTRMTEFEKIASDPKRLFKSSFQLNQEERFRNTAYPNLLKLEERIFALISEYEDKYGEFVYEKLSYRLALQLEISNRIINRTVFISRCDSPYRKKK